ncbi:MAG: DUF2442 domain-containing protein [Devosia sp.]
MDDTLTVEISDAEIEQARQRGEALHWSEPRALSAEYDPITGRVRVELVNGSTFWFPTSIVQGLENASPDQLGDITLIGDGYAIHWEQIDEGIPVPALMAGRFGNDRHMAALAKRLEAAAASQ